MPQLESSVFLPQLIWLAITFIGLYLLMTNVILPRIGGTIEQRRSKIADDLDTAQHLKNDTDKAIAAYEQALAEARNEAHRIAQENRDKLNGEIEAERARVDAEVAEKTEAAERSITETKERALAEVRNVARDVAGDIVLQLTGQKVTKAAVDGAIAKVAERQGVPHA